MVKTHFSANLFQQLGGTPWVRRSNAVFHDVPGLSDSSSYGPDAVSKEKTPTGPADGELPLQAGSVSASVVLIGPGLSAIWENEGRAEWWLWQAICNAFSWNEAHVQFYDTDLLANESCVFVTIEEIIASGAEWVLNLQAEDAGQDGDALAQQLSDGLQVLSVPGLELMLADPYAKQSFYQTVVSFLKSH